MIPKQTNIDPELGVWTRSYLTDCLASMTDAEFFDCYKCAKDRAAAIEGIAYETNPTTPGPIPEPDKGLVAENADLKDKLVAAEATIRELTSKIESFEKPPLVVLDPEDEDETIKIVPGEPISPELQADLDDLHWTQFLKKYGIKPNDFEDAHKQALKEVENG